MKIGILGGTFDPPHWAHLILAEFVRDEKKLDRVWIVPAFMPPHKTEYMLTSPEIRLNMVDILCGDDRYIRPSDVDLIHGREPSFTIDLLDELSQKKFPQHRFTLIIGGDSMVEFTKWNRWEEILERYDVVVFPRLGMHMEDVHPAVISGTCLLKSPFLDISSSEIRRRIAHGHSIRFMTTDAVRKFIEENKLYR